MSTQSTIYSRSNPELLRLFEQAGHPARLMCVALDYAKRQHSALICNGLGDVLQGTFTLENSPRGVRALRQVIGTVARQRKIRPEHVFVGGEDCPSFADNFIRALRSHVLVVRVNAWEAKRQRDNFQASSDHLDLLGIARCCLNRRGVPLREWPEAYAKLRIVTRDRDKLVRQRTATSNRIHAYVDRLWPGFLNAEASGLAPFGPASLDLMEEGLSPERLKTRPVGRLALWLNRRGVSDPQEAAQRLKSFARDVLLPAPEQAGMLQESLTQLVKLYRCEHASIGSVDRELAHWLARTPGALLTTIPGVGVTLAAGWMAELGPPADWHAVRQISSYGGVVPRTKQTGGPDQQPVVGTVQQRCNKRFKNVLLQAVEKVRQFGPEDLQRCAQELERNGSHVAFALAKRLVRLCKHLVLTGTIYRPKALLDPHTPKAELAAYYEATWQKLLPKWKGKADWAEVFAAAHPLGQWRDMVRELYALELPLPQSRGRRDSGAVTP